MAIQGLKGLLLVLASIPSLGLGKEPEPESSAQKQAEAGIRERRKAQYARRGPQDLRSLAYQLMDDAAEAGVEPVLRFVLLREARDLSAEGGDGETALDAIDLLAREFEVNAPEMKAAALLSAERSASTPEDRRALAKGAISLIAELVEADRYDQARTLLKKAQGWAQKAQDPSLAGKAQEYLREMTRIHGDLMKVRAAEKTLAEKPGDPGANLTVGKFLCLVKGDWAGGVSKLRKCSDLALQAAAEKEESRSADPLALCQLGDFWYGLMEKDREIGPLGRSRLLPRVLERYQRALPGLEDEARAKLEERIRAVKLRVLPEEVKVILGKHPRQKGISPRRNGDGLYEGRIFAGKPCVGLERSGPTDQVRYLYFDVGDEWAEPGGDMELEMVLYDGPPGPFTVEYSSTQGYYRTANRTVPLSGKPEWKTVRLPLPQTSFRNRQNAGSDLRIRRQPGAPLFVHKVTLRRVSGS